MGNRPWIVVGLVVFTVLAGCSLPFDDQQNKNIGHEGGYSPTDELNVTADDGLNESERKAVVARTMARVESIRGLEFERRVPVRVISRAEYRNESRLIGKSADHNVELTEQLWEALFLVDESTNASQTVSEVYKGSVLGYYSEGRIVIVSDSETPRIDPFTLAHELTHALQDQQLTLDTPTSPHDAQLAGNGLVEGDANSVQDAYADRCEGEWSCLPQPHQPAMDSTRNQGVYSTVIVPYTEGPEFVTALRDRGGWTAVDDVYEQLPQSTEQIIHPERYPSDGPQSVRIENRSTGRWQQFGAETVGEASIYTMFHANGVINRSMDSENYSHTLSAGWAGDQLVPYSNTAGQYGYVWKTVWETDEDAAQFASGYERLLERHNASETDGVFVVPESDPYADAFDLRHTGRTVTIVNAPTSEEINQISPP